MTANDPSALRDAVSTPTVVVSMSTFRLPLSTAESDEEDPPERSAWDDLSFSTGFGERVRGQLEPLRPFEVEHLTNPGYGTLTARMEQIRAAIAAGGCAVVHVVGHGFLRRDNKNDLMLVAADTVDTNPFTAFDIKRFLQDVDAGRGRVLLLLDVCHAGAGIDWTRDIQRADRRLFVIAACPPDAKAWGGRFSQAVGDVLERLAKGHTGIDPTERFVRLSWLKDELYRRVLDLCDEAGALEQEVTSSQLDAPDVSFLSNPWFREDPVEQLKLRSRWVLQDFIDSVHPTLDLDHYVSRAGGAETGEPGGPCHFSGRQEELTALADWIADGAGDGGTLAVVTGSPGAGKSALLGVVVCCAHPQLSKGLTAVVQSVPAACRPDPRQQFAAVHARGMTLEKVMQAVGEQLLLTPPHERWTAQDLVEAVAGLAEEPLIVIDALDEAAESTRIAVELLLPLVDLEFPGGPRSWACQLLVGVRPYWESMGSLREAARRPRRLFVDLDATDRDRLRATLAEYTERLLNDSEAYRDERRLRKAVASAVAARVSGSGGEFLKAQLAARTIGGAEVLGPQEVVAAVSRIPLSLADLLDDQLDEERTSPWARPVLTAIAFAEGEGMPADLVRSVAPVFHADQAEASWDDVTAALEEMSFYLRRDVDPDHGTTLYRLFHRELADHLRYAAGGGDR